VEQKDKQVASNVAVSVRPEATNPYHLREITSLPASSRGIGLPQT
jgi:hypothetical protein